MDLREQDMQPDVHAETVDPVIERVLRIMTEDG